MFEDNFIIKLIEQLETRLVEGFIIIEGLLTFQKKIYLFRKLRSKFLELYYAKPENRYFDKQKIRERLAIRYYFLKLRKKVANFIIKYDLYRRIKHERHRSYRKLQPSRASINTQSLVAINQIIKLLTFKDFILKNSYNSIFVIINRLIDYGIFLFYRKNLNIE